MRNTWLAFSQAVTVTVAVFFVVSTLKPEWVKRPVAATPAAVAPATIAPLPLPPITASGVALSYAAAAKRASPAVVSITASKAPARDPRMEDPLFQFFFGNRLRQQQRNPQVGLGSGVIVSPEGYLLTNNHVIDGADNIEVMLTDGRHAQAKLVGTDPESDVAVLKITLDRLPSVQLGDADQLQVGDVVLAIGNPFGVGQTVTSGIVSALGRSHLGINTFENFIQTDAAINPGNSGGALVDTNGKLLGINTAIYSRSGGSLGIGFAIPVSAAKQVMDALIKDGKVSRGWIGVEHRELTPEVAQTLSLPITQGVLITGVQQNSPAAAAGMQPGDVVVSVAGKPITSSPQLLNAVAALQPQTTATMEVQRGEKLVALNISVGLRPRVNNPRDEP